MSSPQDQSLVRRKTFKRWNNSFERHFLTFSCFQRQPFLVRDRTRTWLATAIRQALEKYDLDLHAYVFMPEHVHLVVAPNRADCDLSAVLFTIKQSVAQKAVAFVKGQAPDFLARMTDRQPNGRTTIRFWQRGPGYDRNLWSPRETWEKIRYIHANPVQRQLCELPVDWLWSSAADYAGERSGPLPVKPYQA